MNKNSKLQKLMEFFVEKDVSFNIINQISDPLCEKTNKEKEVIAEKLFNAVQGKETPEEMLEAAKALKL